VPEVGGTPVLGGCLVLASFVYVVACRLFALVLLLRRSDRSKELELLRRQTTMYRADTSKGDLQQTGTPDATQQPS
jgi:hypothetical protein